MFSDFSLMNLLIIASIVQNTEPLSKHDDWDNAGWGRSAGEREKGEKEGSKDLFLDPSTFVCG